MKQVLERLDTQFASSRAMQQDVQESARYANVYTSGSTIPRKYRNSAHAAMFDGAVLSKAPSQDVARGGHARRA